METDLKRANCWNCGRFMYKEAFLADDGWLLNWQCDWCEHTQDEGLIDWPFGDEKKTGEELEEVGYRIVYYD